MRKIVNAPESALVIARRAERLLLALDEWAEDSIKNAIEESHLQLSYEEFHDIVVKAADRDPGASRTLRAVAQVLFPHTPKARGRPLSTATVTHALLLVLVHDRPGPDRYTYSDRHEDFVDPRTRATRREFDQPGFSPTRAVELVEKHRLT
jgi:hypothetical protein